MPLLNRGNVNTALGGRTTSTAAAGQALLDFEIGQRRNEILRLTGQQGPKGFIQGDIERDLFRAVSDLERQRGLAVEDVINAMRQGGTLFSGVRAREQARAQHPFITSLARVHEDAARTLGDLYTQLSDLQRERQVRLDMLLADEARMRGEMLRSQAMR